MAPATPFLEITNIDIYNEIKSLRTEFQAQKDYNTREHALICKRLDYTNGTVKTNKWISTTALTFALVLLGFLFQHLSAS